MTDTNEQVAAPDLVCRSGQAIVSGQTIVSGEKYEFANSLRGLAAVSVVIAHLVTAFWLGQPLVAMLTGIPALMIEPPLFATLLNSVPVNFASFGVGLFFIISGFVIPFSLERYDGRAFLVGRVFRIYPTYWVGFTVTLLAILAGAAWFGGQVTFTASQAIQHYLPPLRAMVYSKPLDGIIWTLEIELFFYLLCAALARRIGAGDIRVALVPVVLFAGWLILYLGLRNTGADWARVRGRLEFAEIYTPFLIFMFCGVALNFRQREKIGLAGCAVWVGMCFAMLMAAWRTGRFTGIIEPGSYGSALGLFICAMIFQNLFRANRMLQFLAAISYPLYVVHGVAGYALLQILCLYQVGPWLALTVTLTLVFMLAWFIHIFVEVPTHRLGQRLARRVSRNDRANKRTS